MIYYAGIGSRETPRQYIELFKRVGKYLATQGLTLRSGGANGADLAFEIGCDMVNGKKEIYLPSLGFNNSTSKLVVSKKEAYDIAKYYHPQWSILKPYAKKLQARNSHQVLGEDLNTPSSFIICWTRNGNGQGGTGQALRIARDKNIPIFDCGHYNDINECRKALFDFLQPYIK